MKCPVCAYDNYPEVKFCENCGQALPRVCLQCGEPIRANAKFCGHCGSALHPTSRSNPSETSTSSERLAILRKSAPQALQDKIHAVSSHIQGERKPVTILFTDIVGSTSLAERLDPEEWREILMGAHQRVSEAVYRYEGTIAQLLGDGVLAFFGAPVTHEDDPLRAVCAAIDLERAMSDYAATLAPSIPNFQMRVGINTGIVVVGNISHDLHVEYTATGDAMNLAARLQAAAEPGKVLISISTYHSVRHAVDVHDLGAILVKGKAAPVRAYEVQGLKEVWGRGRGLVSGDSALVGRIAELRALQAISAAVQAGIGRTAVVIGEPGQGKSRLLSEWQQHEPGMLRWMHAECLSYGEGLAYHLIIALLRSLLDVTATSVEAETATALTSLTWELWGPDGDETSAFLGHLLSLRLTGAALDFVQGLNPHGFQVRYTEAVRRLLLALSAQRPLALICEDVHWADAASIDLLTKMLPLAHEAPLLFCFVMRPDQSAPGWGLVTAARTVMGAGLTELQLSPLSEGEVGQLASNLLKTDVLPAEIRALILDKADGNPLFVEEVINVLLEQGGLQRDAAGQLKIIDDHAVLNIPDSLNRLMLARIDRLAEEPKRTLRVASIIGREFLVRILEEVLIGIGKIQPRPQLLSQLRTLEFTNLIQLVSTRSEIGYLFRHALVQEAAYEAVLKSDRRVLHRAAAEALERAYPERLDELAATLAYHFEHAEAHEQALYYLTRAADQARARFANAEAIALYRAAIGQAEAVVAIANADAALRRQPIELREKLGAVLVLIGQHEAARAAYNEVFALLPEADVIGRARLNRHLGNAWMEPRQYDQALRAFADAETLLTQLSSETDLTWQHEWLDLQLSRAWAQYWINDLPAMMALTQRIQPLVERVGDALQRARYYRSLVLMALRRERYLPPDETLYHARAALAAAQASSELSEIDFAEFVLGFCHMWRNELPEAEAHFRTVLELAERIGDVERIVLALTYSTIVCRRRKQMAQVKEFVPLCITAATEARIPTYIGVAKANLAWANYMEGNLASAEANAQAALEIVSAPGFPVTGWACWPLLAIALNANDLDRALAVTRPMLQSTHFRQPDSIETELQSAVHCFDTGDRSRAIEHLTTAVHAAQATGYF